MTLPTSTRERFRERLGEIRATETRRAAQARLRRRGEAGRRASQLLAVFHFLDEVETDVRHFADGLDMGLSVKRRAFATHFEFEALLDEQHVRRDGTPSRERSRVILRIEPDSSGGAAKVLLGLDVHDRSRERHTLRVDFADEDRSELRTLLERVFLELARARFAAEAN